MICIKCKKEIPENSVFCNYCGKKQVSQKRKRTRKRAHGTGSITRNKNNSSNSQYVVRGPATPGGKGRVYIGSFPDMATAQSALDEYIKNGRPKLHNITVEGIYKLWSEAHFDQLSEKSIEGYEWAWKRFEPIYKVKMSELRADHIQQLVKNANGSYPIAYQLKVLASQLFKYAIKNDVVQTNYAPYVELPKKGDANKVIFTRENIATLWEHSDDERVKAILAMIYTGFRISELYQLKVENIHLEEGYIIGGIKTETGKNRIVPFPSEIPEVKEYFANLVKNSKPDGTLFHISKAGFRKNIFYAPLFELKIIDGYLKGSKLVFNEKHHITQHSTRHTFATICAASGMRPENLRKIIGHKSYQTTVENYIHADITTLKDEMQRITV